MAAELAVQMEGSIESLVLLDPALEISAEYALGRAEIDRLDWSFETPEGGVNALLAGSDVIATSRETIETYVKEDMRRGSDGLYRFSFCPSAVVAAWSEMCLPAPPIAAVPTLALIAQGSSFTVPLEERYRASLAARFSVVRVPNGHNVLWESAEETAVAVEHFLDVGGVDVLGLDPVPGYVDAHGSFHLLG